MKKYIPISRVEALQLLIDNNANAIGSMAFRDSDNFEWRESSLVQVNCDQNTTLAFCTPQATYVQCARVVEVDPTFEALERWKSGYKYIASDGIDELARAAFFAGAEYALTSVKGMDSIADQPRG